MRLFYLFTNFAITNNNKFKMKQKECRLQYLYLHQIKLKKYFMKKIASILALASVVAFSSCKKTWTCECTTTTNGVSNTVSATSPTKMTKKDAKKSCENGNTSYSVGGVTASVTCKLK